MKICSTCSSEHQQPRSSLCLHCQRKAASLRYSHRNRKALNEYAKHYREKNRLLVRKRIKRSKEENIEYYKQRALERFIKKKGLPADYKRWKRGAGEGSITQSGYKVVTSQGHPNAFDSRGRISEHTLVMTQHLGRPLHKGETVHHINGDRLDNRIENLELWYRSHPPGQRVDDKIAWAIDLLLKYGYKVEKA